MLADLITSKSRVKLLTLFLTDIDEMHHVRDCVRKTGDEINAVRRELQLLEQRGILIKEQRGNRLYYAFNREYPFFYDLLTLGAKTIGLGAAFLENRAKLGKIKYAMFSGAFARKIKHHPEDIDFLVVGTVVLPELAILIRAEENRLAREINYTAMSEEEFAFRKKRSDPFISGILAGTRIMLLGDEEAMLRA